jgi:hypothetical protein
MTITIELTEAEAEALDRYVEEGCYDRDKLIKRRILEMTAAPGAPWLPAPPVALVKGTGDFISGDWWSATSEHIEPLASRSDHRHPVDSPRADHEHPVCRGCTRKSDHDDLTRAFELSRRRAEKGLPTDPALLL